MTAGLELTRLETIITPEEALRARLSLKDIEAIRFSKNLVKAEMTDSQADMKRAKERQIEAKSNFQHFLNLLLQILEAAEHFPHLNTSLMIRGAMLHDLGKFPKVRERVKMIWLEYEKWTKQKPNGNETIVFQFIESLTHGQLNVLKNAWNSEKPANWVIDHQVVSAIYLVDLISKNEITFIDQWEVEQLLKIILEHINVPHFMIDEMAKKKLKYSNDDLTGLVVCADIKEGGSCWRGIENLNKKTSSDRLLDRISNMLDHNGPFSILSKQFSLGRIKKITKIMGFSSLEALVFSITDSSELGNPEGSYFKVICNILDQQATHWEIRNGQKIPASFQYAHNQVESGSYHEVLELGQYLGEPFVTIFSQIDESRRQAYAEICDLLKAREIPVSFGQESMNNLELLAKWNEDTLQIVMGYSERRHLRTEYLLKTILRPKNLSAPQAT